MVRRTITAASLLVLAAAVGACRDKLQDLGDGAPADAPADGGAPADAAAADARADAADARADAADARADTGAPPDGGTTCSYPDGGAPHGGAFTGVCPAAGCPAGSICVLEIGGVAGGGGEYCAPVPSECHGSPSCACMATCACTHPVGGRPERCSERDGSIACDNGIR